MVFLSATILPLCYHQLDLRVLSFRGFLSAQIVKVGVIPTLWIISLQCSLKRRKVFNPLFIHSSWLFCLVLKPTTFMLAFANAGCGSNVNVIVMAGFTGQLFPLPSALSHLLSLLYISGRVWRLWNSSSLTLFANCLFLLWGIFRPRSSGFGVDLLRVLGVVLPAPRVPSVPYFHFGFRRP